MKSDNQEIMSLIATLALLKEKESDTCPYAVLTKNQIHSILKHLSDYKKNQETADRVLESISLGNRRTNVSGVRFVRCTPTNAEKDISTSPRAEKSLDPHLLAILQLFLDS